MRSIVDGHGEIGSIPTVVGGQGTDPTKEKVLITPKVHTTVLAACLVDVHSSQP